MVRLITLKERDLSRTTQEGRKKLLIDKHTRNIMSGVKLVVAGKNSLRKYSLHSLDMLLQDPGGGALGLEKGTDCGPTAGERWLSRPATAKKGGLSFYHIVG